MNCSVLRLLFALVITNLTNHRCVYAFPTTKCSRENCCLLSDIYLKQEAAAALLSTKQSETRVDTTKKDRRSLGIIQSSLHQKKALEGDILVTLLDSSFFPSSTTSPPGINSDILTNLEEKSKCVQARSGAPSYFLAFSTSTSVDDIIII